MGPSERPTRDGVWLPENRTDELDDRALEEAIARANRAEYAALFELSDVA